jgi:hypothetical protein
MSEKQRSSLRQVLAGFFADGARVFRHRDCIGADAQPHVIAKATGFRVVIHPPSDGSKRAFCQGDAVLTPRPYLVRNRRIVDASSVLILSRWHRQRSRRRAASGVAGRPRRVTW